MKEYAVSTRKAEDDAVFIESLSSLKKNNIGAKHVSAPVCLDKCCCCCSHRIGGMFPLLARKDGTPILIVGPGWAICLFLTFPIILVGSSLISYFLFFIECWWMLIIIDTLAFVTLVSLVFVSCSDPGLLERNTDETSVMNGWCWDEQVGSFRPTTAVYCSDCKVVIKDFDHYCPWTGTSIGEGNIRAMNVFLISANLLLFLCVGVVGYITLKLMPQIVNMIKSSKNKTPILLDIPWAGGSFISSTLSECSDLIEAKLEDLQNINTKFDFITASSMCDIGYNLKNFKIFAMFRNPIVHVATLFVDKQDPFSPLFDDEVNKMNFEEFLESSLHMQNYFLKKMLCVYDRSLNYADLDMAKTIIDENSFVLFQNRDVSYQKILSLFRKTTSAATKACVQRNFYAEVSRNLEKVEYIIKNNLRLLMEFNKLDMFLYQYAVEKALINN